MPAAVLLSSARSELWLPPLALAGCVRAGLLRDTTGVVLSDAQRHNHFPATPLVSLSWWFTGHSEMLEGVERPDSRRPVPGRFVFGGPFTRPSTSYNHGPVHAMMLMLLPDAMHLLTGLDPQAHVNRLSDARLVLPAPWLTLGEAVLQASDDRARWRLIEEFMRPRWATVRQSSRGIGAQFQRYQDWAQGLMLRAATSATGRSLRQTERRIKQWAGLPMRELKALSRAERVFFDALAAQADSGSVDWVEVALQGGYADQSHLCRETRRITGFSPEELRRRIAGDESFWAYRLWE